MQARSVRRTERYALSALVEGFCWLSLGNSLSYFPIAGVRSEIDRLRQDLAPRLADYSSDWNYVIDDTWFSIFRDVVETGRSPSLAITDGTHDQTIRFFRSCLVCAIRLSKSPCAEAVVMILDFDHSEDIVETFIKAPLRIGGIETALNRRLGLNTKTGDIPLGSMYAGFGQLVESLDSLRSLYFSNVSRSDTSLPEVNSLFRQVSRLMRWKSYFISHDGRTSLREAFVERFLVSVGVTELDRHREYSKYLRQLGDFWRNAQIPGGLEEIARPRFNVAGKHSG